MGNWEVLIESTIDAIHVNPLNKEVMIDVTCAWEGRDQQRIIATGVDDFVINEMRLTNIIDRVNRFDRDDIGEKDTNVMTLLFFMMRGKYPSDSDLEWPILREKLACIREGALSLLEIVPVYGAAIIILAKCFNIEVIDAD